MSTAVIASAPPVRDGKRLVRYGYRVQMVPIPAARLHEVMDALAELGAKQAAKDQSAKGISA
jgi:hypothetical protein